MSMPPGIQNVEIHPNKAVKDPGPNQCKVLRGRMATANGTILPGFQQTQPTHLPHLWTQITEDKEYSEKEAGALPSS